MLLNKIHVILSHPSHPGNVGAAARAMKTMGLSQLALLNPKIFPCAEATARAAGADDILMKAQVVSTLPEALGNATLIFACSARERALGLPVLTPEEAVERCMAEPDTTDIAFLFGNERTGLENHELQCAHALVCIPTNEDYASLNLAAAVQIIAYALRARSLSPKIPATPSEYDSPCATAEEMAGFYQHLRTTLSDIGFLNPRAPKRLMERLQHLFNRARPTKTELNILRGMLKSIQRS